MTTRKSILAVLASVTTLACVGLVATARADQAAPATATTEAFPLAGAYLLASDATSSKARQAAIDRAVEEFFFAVRPIVRSKLEKVTRIVEWAQIRKEGDLVVVHFAGRAPIPAKLRATATKWTDPEGNTHDVKHSIKGATLVQSISNPEGSRKNVFSLTKSGLLRIDVEISSPKLDAPLRYHVSYKRR